ncbi:MAG: dethiobiotin synthase [Ferruginibacter sp.]|nr:dethiobiotin synthase [Cytophagales bacterium]
MVYFVTAIHTDSGKTLVSAILTQALQADYWKPIQAGLPRDTDLVMSLVTNTHSVFHQEAYQLQTPASPHAAARAEGMDIRLSDILLPKTQNDNLVMEGAGGVLVPLNGHDFVIDLAEKFDAKIILVSNHYLGSINHTLLTVHELKRRGLKVRGIVFNGPPNPDTEAIVLQHSGYPCLLRILPEAEVSRELVNHYALELLANLNADTQALGSGAGH